MVTKATVTHNDEELDISWDQCSGLNTETDKDNAPLLKSLSPNSKGGSKNPIELSESKSGEDKQGEDKNQDI